VRWNMLARNPCEAVELPRQSRREMLAFSPEDAGRFLKAAAEDVHGTLFAFALATEMRPEEYLALKWSDVDLQTGVATVVRTLIWRKGGEWYFGEPKTARSRRNVPLPATILSALQEHKRRQGAERLKAGANYQTNGLVFAMCDGRPILHRTLDRLHFKPTLKHAKLSES